MDFISGELTGAVLFGALALLALIDSTSFGTLLIPVWLLMTPGRVRAGRILVYLGSIAGFYAVLGILILLFASTLGDLFAGLADSRPFLIAQLAVGVGLFVWSFRLDPASAQKRAAKEAAEREAERIAAGLPASRAGDGTADGAAQSAAQGAAQQTPAGGRLNRWRERAVGSEAGSMRGLVALAVTAGLVEIASMLPYLAALGLIGTQGPGWPMSGLWILGYCAIMIAPALVFLTLRVVAAGLVERPLSRLDAWLTKNAASTTAWVVGIVGFLVARDAIGRLWG
ncbi:GAP family protein [Promicromonospora sp. Populi]|uniref:GAP family protein n=1 Tax=Promicromonospora sp. Populi TaxID=3239420 RepID=UPI0034E2B5BF